MNTDNLQKFLKVRKAHERHRKQEGRLQQLRDYYNRMAKNKGSPEDPAAIDAERKYKRTKELLKRFSLERTRQRIEDFELYNQNVRYAAHIVTNKEKKVLSPVRGWQSVMKQRNKHVMQLITSGELSAKDHQAQLMTSENFPKDYPKRPTRSAYEKAGVPYVAKYPKKRRLPKESS